MRGREFLTVAEDLARQSDSEAALRSAVSRAYYAAFNHAREVLVALGFTTVATGGAHGEVHRYFQNCGVDELVEQGQHLGNLHRQRIQADYKLSDSRFQGNPNAATLWTQLAKQLIETLAKYETGAERRRARAGMRRYAQMLGQ